LIEGALILLLGIVIGYAIALLSLWAAEKAKARERPYDQYKNEKGLYSRKTIRFGKS
jgi:hypothetical protein